MSNTPKNGDFAAYVDEIQLRQQRALQLLPAHNIAHVSVSKTATGFATSASAAKDAYKNNPAQAVAAATPHAKPSATAHSANALSSTNAPHTAHRTDEQTRKHNATSHAQLADHAFGRTASEIRNNTNKSAVVAATHTSSATQTKAKDDEVLAAPQDAWEARWQPVFLFVVENRSKFIGLVLASAVTIVSVITIGFAVAIMLGFNLDELELSDTFIKSSWLAYWSSWTASMARTKLLLIAAIAVIGLCVRYIAKTWNAIVEFAARESDINTFIGVLLALALLEAVMFFKIGISGVVWVAVLLAGGATKAAWRVIVAVRRVLLNIQPAQ